MSNYFCFHLLQLLLLTSAAHGCWEIVSALLQDKTKDINLNCSNEVCCTCACTGICVCTSICVYMSHLHVLVTTRFDNGVCMVKGWVDV